MSKKTVHDLAVLGGKPLFAEPLHVGRPNIVNPDGFKKRIDEILERKWLTNYGPCVQEFEKRLAEYLGVRHCIVMCNGTIALEIAIRALDLKGEVIVPAMTFIATAHALKWQEIEPVFCDVDPITGTLDPKDVKQRISSRTTAILGVHLWGRPCEVQELQDIATKNNLKLIFDAAHAFGCTYKGKKIGGFGSAEVFSFHATKILNTLEGGAIATNDDALANRIRLMKNFGFSGYDEVSYIGTNGKMNEISAAMGLNGLPHIDYLIEQNHLRYQRYVDGLQKIKGIQIIPYAKENSPNYQYVICLIDERRFGFSRDTLIKILWAENIRARRYFYPGCHRMEPYKSAYSEAQKRLPITDDICKKVIALPTGTAVSMDDIDHVTGFIQFVNEYAEQLQKSIPLANG